MKQKTTKTKVPATDTTVNNVEISTGFRKAVYDRKLVVLAGAGVSTASPASLPGWFSINQMIVQALCVRVESYLGSTGYLDQIRSSIDQRRNSLQFPPDYQAQIIAEYAGADYFKALQSLDITVRNTGHDSLAYLASKGLIAAIVTTNFDRLIEQALDAVSVEYEVAFDTASYERLLASIEAGGYLKIPVLKVHGCVSNANSMVDTLKQRLLGRNESLNSALELLIERHPWLYAGFSASDLETDDNYLRILTCAHKSPGIAYVQRPGSHSLSAGATKLFEKYAGKAEKIVADTPAVLMAIAGETTAPALTKAGTVDTNSFVTTHLANWANALDPAAAINCLAAICESNGMTNAAFDLLHRYWRNVLTEHREGPDFDRYRQLHGRLGMGNGLLSLAEDANSTKGEESLQNLLRRAHDGDPLAACLAGVAFMWDARKDMAMGMLSQHMNKVAADLFPKEVSVDCWMAIAEVNYFYCEPETILQSWHYCWNYAEKAGDLPRQAKCAALTAVYYASFADNYYNDFVNTAKPVFDRAARLHDPFIDGFIQLAEGRYCTRTVQNPKLAAEKLGAAYKLLNAAGRPAWALFAQIQYAKALADNRQMEEAAKIINDVNKKVDRWQILSPLHMEAVGQFNFMLGQKTEARKAFEMAIEYATTAQIPRLADTFQQYLLICQED